MHERLKRGSVVAVLVLAGGLLPACVQADAPAATDALASLVAPGKADAAELSNALRILVLLTVLSLVPALMIATTSFLRIIVVLSMLRQALGMPDTPPNAALISIALFLTLFTMSPVLRTIDQHAWQPFQARQLSLDQALVEGLKPLRDFMVRQTRENDLALMVELAGTAQPESVDDIGITQLIPAFMLSELRSAFQIGFMIFLPFLMIDIVIASILTSLGMMMVPPITIALPLKILMFILIDGWNLVVRSLMSSFQ